MATEHQASNQVRQLRTAAGLTQSELAMRAGISRSAVTAIEGDRLVPSVSAALALAKVLGSTVEVLFASRVSTAPSEAWAWESPSRSGAVWRAEVFGKTINYPAESAPMLSMLPDGRSIGSGPQQQAPGDTLVLACCDPAAGILASEFARVTGLRLIVLPRSSGKSIELLRDGLVHLAGLHLATSDEPNRNIQMMGQVLGDGYQLVRIARWQEGIALAPATTLHSVRAVRNARLNWVGREAGSGARQCQDRILEKRPAPRRVALDHRGVVDAVRSGWADAGVCVQLVSAEAGLRFLSVQEEAFDICFSKAFSDDRRMKAFLKVVRSPAYRKLLNDLPGYNNSETGALSD